MAVSSEFPNYGGETGIRIKEQNVMDANIHGEFISQVQNDMAATVQLNEIKDGRDDLIEANGPIDYSLTQNINKQPLI